MTTPQEIIMTMTIEVEDDEEGEQERKELYWQ